jgi:hypothetical protein
MAEVSQSLKSFLIFSILSALYILSMFYRVSNAIIAPNLIQDLGLDAETLGIPRGSFFYFFYPASDSNGTNARPNWTSNHYHCAAVFMPAMGKIIELFPRVNHTYPAKAYHLSFLICFLGMAVSIIFYAFSKRERKGDVTPRRGDTESKTQ